MGKPKWSSPKQQQQQEVERHEAVLDLLGYAAGKKKNFSLLTPQAKKKKDGTGR